MITLRCPWETPPLRSNQRLHWAKKANATRAIRTDALIVATTRVFGPPWFGNGHAIPITVPVVVSLIWEVTDKRRRDVGAAAPTLKAWIDGMVDAGLLAGDHHQIVTEERLRIEVGTRRGVRVEIEPAS